MTGEVSKGEKEKILSKLEGSCSLDGWVALVAILGF